MTCVNPMHLLAPLVIALAIAGCARAPRPSPPPDRDRVLDQLRDAVNENYGFRGDTPRVNLGPCGRFARDFRERWNARFREPCHVIFLMADDGSQCHHVLVRLPGGRCYDGGNGVIAEQALLRVYPNSHVEDMTVFDPALLDRRSYGLARSYPECPNYSDALTRRLIDSHLAMLPSDR
jgi:hypothetical protein